MLGSEIGTELFVITCSSLRSDMLVKRDGNKTITLLNDCIFSRSKLKIDSLFHDLKKNNDKNNYKLSKKILEHQYENLEIPK